MIVADNLEKIEMRADRIEEMDERAGGELYRRVYLT